MDKCDIIYSVISGIYENMGLLGGKICFNADS